MRSRGRGTVAPKKPIKAKGRLPAPRVAPRRVRRPIHRRRGPQILAGLILVTLVGLGINEFLDSRQAAETKRAERRSVRQFDNNLTILLGPVETAVPEMSSFPGQMASGQIDPAAFTAKTEEWLKALRAMTAGLAEEEPPKTLLESRALFHTGATLYIDVAKMLQFGASSEPSVRDAQFSQARHVMNRAASVMGLGKRELEIGKRRYGLGDPTNQRLFIEQPIPLLQEEVPPPAPAAPEDSSPLDVPQGGQPIPVPSRPPDGPPNP